MGSSYSVEVAAMNAMMGFIVMIVFVCLAGVAAQVLLGLATYNDAKARGNNDPVMWGLLVGFLGWIPGIVYLCLRNNNANRLMTCRSADLCTGWRSHFARSAACRIHTARRFRTHSRSSRRTAQNCC